MSDLIDRQAAIDAIREETCGCAWDAKDILSHLPPVRVAEKTGQWIHTDECDEEWQYRCSVCNMPSRSNNHHYCSQCGSDMFARMVEPQESEE